MWTTHTPAWMVLTLYLIDRNKNVYFDEKSSEATFHLLPDVSPYSRDSRKLESLMQAIVQSMPALLWLLSKKNIAKDFRIIS